MGAGCLSASRTQGLFFSILGVQRDWGVSSLSGTTNRQPPNPIARRPLIAEMDGQALIPKLFVQTFCHDQ